MHPDYGTISATSSSPSTNSDNRQEHEDNLINTPHSKCLLLCMHLRRWISLISVEPTMFFYMIAFMLTTVIEQSFYVYKACSANHGYPDEVCNNLDKPMYKNISDEVQKTVSNFHQWNGIAGHVFPIILAFFMGAWSDKRGRKVLLICGLLGNLWLVIWIIINTVKPLWPVEYVIYTATLPSAFTGTNVVIFAGCFSYLADITTPENRTLRIGILDIIYLSTMPIGVYLGARLYVLFDKSYTIMFSINAACLFIALMHTLFNLKWQTNPNQKSLKQAGVTNPIKDFFDLNLMSETFSTVFKKREGNRRTFVWLLFLAMTLYTFQRDEKPMLYLYTTKVFGWDVAEFSKFKTFYSSFFVIMMLLGIPTMSKGFKWRDTTIAMLGALSHATGRIFFITAKSITFLYLGASVASLGPCVAPVIRSMASKAVDPKEKGKVYAVLSVCDNAVVLFSATMYTQIYNATISTSAPYSIFFLTMGTQVIVFLCSLIIHAMLRGEQMNKYYLLDLEKDKLDEATSSGNQGKESGVVD